MTLAILFIASLGQDGDSCVSKADCESGLACSSGTCTAVAGKGCKRSSDCAAPMRCRQNACVDPGAQAAPPPAQPYPQQAPPPAYQQQPVYQPYPQPYGQPAYGQQPYGANYPPGSTVAVTIHSQTGRPFTASLYSMAGPAAQCMAPCTLHVPPGNYTLQVGGEGVRVKKTQIQIMGDTMIAVKAGSSAALSWGIADLVLGAGVFLPVGIALTVVGVSNSNAGGLATVGVVVIVLSVALIVLGPVLIGTSGSKIQTPGPQFSGLDFSPLPGGGRLTLGMTF